MEQDLIEKATAQLDTIGKENADLKKALAEVEKRLSSLDSRFVKEYEADKEAAANYGFSNAKIDVEKGMTAKVPYWPNRTMQRFHKWVQLLNLKDYDSLKKEFPEHNFEQKAFGDNVQTVTSNSTSIWAWIPLEFIPELVRLIYVQSTFLKYVTIVPMMRDQVQLPFPKPTTLSTYADYANPWFTTKFASRGDALLDSKVNLDRVLMQTDKLYSLCILNREDVMDSGYPLAAFVAAQMAEDLAKTIDKTIMYSDKALTTGGLHLAYSSANWDGVAYAALVNNVLPGADASPTFAKAITYENLVAVAATLNELSADGAKWFMSSRAYATARGMTASFPTYNGTTTSTTLGASTLPIMNIIGPYKSPILGFDVEITDRMLNTAVNSDATTHNAVVAMLGNPKWIYFGDRMQFGIDSSEHYRFANDQIVMRALQRFSVAIPLGFALNTLSFPRAA